MNRDDALSAFERHATSKLRTADDLLSIATLGFRGEALPSIASVARVTLETATGEESAGTRVEIAGGKILHVDDAALPRGTTLAVADLFFNTPARRKFLRAESTELAHVTALVTHYALAHPRSTSSSSPHAHNRFRAASRPHGRAHLPDFWQGDAGPTAAVAAETPLAHAGCRAAALEEESRRARAHPRRSSINRFYSKPELQKLNRNSIYIFINKRLIRDRLLMHAITEAYRNVIPPTSFPVVLLFLEMPPEEVDVNVHPAKTEVRFRQQSLIHDFVRDSLRTALIKARPAAGFLAALDSRARSQPFADAFSRFAFARFTGFDAISRAARLDPAAFQTAGADAEAFELTHQLPTPVPGKLPFTAQSLQTGDWGDQKAWSEAAAALFQPLSLPPAGDCSPNPSDATGTNPAAETALIEASKPPPTSTTWARCGRWDSCASRSFWPP